MNMVIQQRYLQIITCVLDSTFSTKDNKECTILSYKDLCIQYMKIHVKQNVHEKCMLTRYYIVDS